jgi:diaminopimelate epimerase
MRFTKMHGLGNDYVYVDCVNGPAPANPAEVARKVSDRHFGIGSDGLILIGKSEIADARMRMFNADGSESEMCGNGLRCVAKYVYDHGIATKPTLAIETGRGVLTVDVTAKDGKADAVRVNMGKPILQASDIPTTLPGDPPINAVLTGDFGSVEVTVVSMGNPHAVIYVPDVDAIPLETIGPKLETHPAFPRRVNVHFVQVISSSEAKMRTWERGSGITLACGTGACAVAVAGVLTGRTGRTLLAHLPGGDLELEWAGDDQPVFMTGPATEVFSGEWSDS